MASQLLSNGWDLIAAATQDSLNAQLAKLPHTHHSISFPIDFSGQNIPGLQATVSFNLNVSPPQLRVKEGSGRAVDVLFNFTGTISANGAILLNQPAILTVTTSLQHVEAELDPHPGQNLTNYDLIIDLQSNDLIVDVSFNATFGVRALLQNVLKDMVRQTIGRGKRYKVASFTLTNKDIASLGPFAAVLPRVADFSFVYNPARPGQSNILVLMQSVSIGRGSLLFNKPVLPDSQAFMVLISNKLFLQYVVLPAVTEQIKAQAKDKNAVDRQIALHALPQSEMFEITNNQNIALALDHNPWISGFNIAIDPSLQALRLFLEAQANVTFLDIHVDSWDRMWQQFNVAPDEMISLKQIKEEKNQSTHLDWWKWLIAALLGPEALIFTGIVTALVSSHNPDLGKSFAQLAKMSVKWPNQQNVILKSITTPGHINLNIDVHF